MSQVDGAPASPNFVGLTSYAKIVWLRATKFGMATHVGCSVFLGDQPRPHPMCWGTSVRRIFGIPTFARTVWETTTKFCMIIILSWKPLHGGPRMLTRDLFTAANLLVFTVLDFRFCRGTVCRNNSFCSFVCALYAFCLSACEILHWVHVVIAGAIRAGAVVSRRAPRPAVDF